MTRLLPSPIFKPHLLAAAYRGEKTQTRRVVNPQPVSNGFRFDRQSGEILCHCDYLPPSCLVQPPHYDHPFLDGPEHFGPYGKPGDFWYFREGLFCVGDLTAYRLGGNWALEQRCPDIAWRWKRASLPSIHMPRALARRFARVVSVRVQRVQDISEADAVTEGVQKNAILPENWHPDHGWMHYGYPPDYDGEGYEYCKAARDSFRTLWDSINGTTKTKTGSTHLCHSWMVNPWVWVYEWEMVEREAVAKGCS